MKVKKISEGVYKVGKCAVMITLDNNQWHLSISRPDRLPSWEEVKVARYELLPDNIDMAMILPPKENYVNVQIFCFHLFEIKDNFRDVSKKEQTFFPSPITK